MTETLTAGQRTLVTALAHETTDGFSEDYPKRHGLGVYRVADPFCAAYLNEESFRC